jgi:phosphoribosyl 1,2-cyclic phosphate phosphodiesterase
MARTLKITVLGCGNSSGTPSIGNYWGKCDPAEPKNRRTRPGIAVQSAATNLIIDTGPDFREQINRTAIKNIDAVIYTHAHGDHIHGIDDLRVMRLRHEKIIDIYGNPATVAELEERFSYLFEQRAEIYPKVLQSHRIEDSVLGQSFTIGDIPVIPFAQDHGTTTTLGLRFGDLAYSTDVVNLDESALATLAGIRTWIVDAAGYKMPENFVHLTLRQVYALNEIVKAENVYLTHMPSFMDYATLLKELPDGFHPCHDGLELEAYL